MENLKIIKATETTNPQHDIATVFVAGYYDWLSMACPDKAKLAAIFSGGFRENTFYIAYLDGKPVGITACTEPGGRAVKIDKARLCAVLDEKGEEAGHATYDTLAGIFHKPLNYPAYIECVATIPEAQGKGIATKLMRYILDAAPYSEYVLDVMDINAPAIKVYEKLGFEVYDTVPADNPAEMGFNAILYMKLCK